MSIRLTAGTFAVAALLLTRAGSAQQVPQTFPESIGGFWFGESVKSAKRKCQSFEAFSLKNGEKGSGVFCAIEQTLYQLAFDAKGKLEFIGWVITPAGYAECAKSIAARVGASGRSEDADGRETWLAIYKKDGVYTGSVMCADTSNGAHMAFMTH